MLESLVALVALSVMEIILGIDNLVFISILTSKLPIERQSAGRRIGLALALIMRILLLSTIFWMSRTTAPLIHLSDFLPVERLQQYFMQTVEPIPDEADAAEAATHLTNPQLDSSTPAKDPSKAAMRRVLNAHAWREFNEVSLRDLILISGGLFLLYKSITEIHSEMEGHEVERQAHIRRPSFGSILFQIALMDIIFSLDSVITAVGMADELWVMITAVILAVAVMILFANQVGNFVTGNPTIKMLALNFLLIIGVMLISEGIGTPFSKGYVYFAMAFSLLVEFLNMRVRKASPTRAAVEPEANAAEGI